MTNLTGYLPRERPGRIGLAGCDIRIEPLNWETRGAGLASAIAGQDNADLWTYVPIGPFDDLAALQATMGYVGEQFGWEMTAIISQADDRVLGTASYMRIREMHGSAEVGCIVFGQALQKTRAATEAMYLMAKHIFEDLGYRRYEWKCHNGNDASKRAAERFGFTFEGIFRNDMVMKGQNRDTAWFSMIDTDWPAIKAGYEAWLSEGNFDGDGQQISSLETFMP